jgi:hypothetical protein
VAEVRLDGLAGDEQRLSDLRVRQAPGGQFGDVSLLAGQL